MHTNFKHALQITLTTVAVLFTSLSFGAKQYSAPADFLVDPTLPYTNVDITLAPGDIAPDFTLNDSNGKTVSLADFRGKQHTLLLFYRGSWCPYCVSHLEDIQNILPKLARHNVQLLAISRDSDKKSAKLAERFNQPYLFLSDKKLKVAEAYGIKRNRVLPHPAVFLIDLQGKVRWFFASSDYEQRPSPAQLLKVIESLNAPEQP